MPEAVSGMFSVDMADEFSNDPRVSDELAQEVQPEKAEALKQAPR